MISNHPEFDNTGNHVDTTIFETYLAKLISENTTCYKDVFQKINKSINTYIENNQSHIANRQLFALFSEFQNLFPQYPDMKSLLEKEFNVEAHTEFHKRFFEIFFKPEKIKQKIKRDNNKVYSLSELVQFAIEKHPFLNGELKKNLRPMKLFSEKGRSRIELYCDEPIETKKLGIISEEFTPPDLKNYFKIPYEAAQSQFGRDPNGFFSRWLKQRELPFIAGPSGTLEIVFCSIIQLDTYTAAELKRYFMATAAAMVTRGHHSFAEVLITAKNLGFPLNDFYEDRQSFYEQFLTPEIINSKPYKDFLREPFVQNYLDTCDNQVSAPKN